MLTIFEVTVFGVTVLCCINLKYSVVPAIYGMNVVRYVWFEEIKIKQKS
jgi:hypothetical protein